LKRAKRIAAATVATFLQVLLPPLAMDASTYLQQIHKGLTNAPAV